MPANTNIAGVEHLPQFVAHQVHDGLEIQLGGQALLDAVDDSQLGVALLGFLEQALGLVEKTGILECHAHAGGHGLHQAYIRLAEGILALIILYNNRTNYPGGADDRYQNQG